MNHAIRNMTHHALLGHGDIPDQPGYCLKMVRRIIEQAYDWPDGEFYRRYGIERTTQGPEHKAWWAADVERGLRELGLGVKWEDRQPGDLVFNHGLAKPYGHVGLFYSCDLVAENNYAKYRPNSLAFPRCLFLTRWEDFPGATLIARIPNGD